MGAIASKITSLTIVYSTVYSDAYQRKHQSSASLAFVCGEFTNDLVNAPHKWPVTRKMFPFDDVIMSSEVLQILLQAQGIGIIIIKAKQGGIVNAGDYENLEIQDHPATLKLVFIKQGWGLLSQFPPFSYFPHFSAL